MTGPVMCECGAVLVAGIDSGGVTTVEGEYVRFTRRTDFVVCASCHRSVPVRDILPPEEGEQVIDLSD